MLKSLLVVLVLLIPPLAAAQTDPEFLITPQVGIGSVVVGAPLEVVKALFGPEDRAAPSGAYTQYTWRTQGKGLLLVWTLNARVVAVGVQQDARYTTDKGVRTGDNDEKVREVMGTPSGVDHASDSRGRRFDVLRYDGIQFVVPRDPVDGVVSQVLQIVVTEGK